MSLLNLPVFTILPDWSDQLSETLEWMTAVMQAQRQGSNGTAAEQRRMLRLSPRRTVDLNLVLIKEARTYFDLLIHAAGASDFYVPLFHNVDVLRTPAAAGDTTIPLENEPYNELPAAASPCILIGPNGPRDYEIFEAGYADGVLTITTDGGLANSWAKGTRLFPMMRAKLATQPQFSELSSNARTASVRFTSVGPQDWVSTGQEGFDSYQDFPVMVRKPNWSESLDGSFVRTINTTDNGSGLWDYADVSGRGFGTQTFTWFCLTRKDHAAVRDMLYFLKGQLTGFWLPTFANDIILAEYPVAADTSLTINWIGYADLGFPVEGRDTLVVFMADGTRVYLRITSASAVDDTTEILGLDAPIGVDLNETSFTKISFMQYSRLSQDAIEIAHHTDNRGVSAISANVSAISYDRDAPDWTPPPLSNPDMLTDGCGFVPAIFLTSQGPNTCGPGSAVFGFNWLEFDEDPPGEDHIAYIHETYGSNGDWSMRWALERSDFTILYGGTRNVAALGANRAPDRAGMAYSIDYDLGFFTDTNAIADNTITTTVVPNLGADVARQGCQSIADWVGGIMSVRVAVSKAGIGIGARNVDYVFAVQIVNAAGTFNFSFPEADTMPITGTQFDFHVSIRCDSAGSARFIITSTYHGTAIDQTYAAPDADTCFNFCLINSNQFGGRASNADLDVLENVLTFSGLSVQA